MKIRLLTSGGYESLKHVVFPRTVEATYLSDNEIIVCGSELERVGAVPSQLYEENIGQGVEGALFFKEYDEYEEL